ncbi:MAG: hypothetical protein CMK36_07205 [Porticoccaceae bacterium]|nr:hypothetical protein [Porticoccaceae bacterium]
MPKYDPKKKKEYYQKHRKERLKYQNDYYERMKSRRVRTFEIMEELEPSQFNVYKQQISVYNKEYYRKNRSKILRKRAETRAKKSK